MKIRHPLLALDGGIAAERAIPWVRLLAPKARLLALRVNPPNLPPELQGAPWIPFPPTEPSEAYLRGLRRRLGASARSLVKSGIPADVILDVASAERCDLIALALRPGAPLLRRFLGGTVERLLHLAEVPLLLVPANRGAARRAPRLRTVAVPLDGSEGAESALPVAAGLARARRARLVLIHSCHDLDRAGELYSTLGGPLRPRPHLEAFRRAVDAHRERRKAHFERLAASLRSRGVEADSLVVSPPPPEGILETARRQKADLLVMSVHGHGAVHHLFLGALASRLLRATRVPVLALRRDPEKEW